MFCKNCGKEIRDGINFCNYCGAPQRVGSGNASQQASQQATQSTRQPTQQPAPQPYAQQPSDAKPQWRMGLLIAGIVLLVFGVLTIASSYSGGDYRYILDRMQRGYYLSDDLEMLLIQMGIMVGGIVLICFSKRRR